MKIIGHHWLTIAALLGGLSIAITANAAAIPAKDNVYHVTSAKQTTWLWNKAHTRKLAAINQLDTQFDYQAWLVDGQMTRTTDGKKVVYYHVTNPHKDMDGYVWRGHLTKGYHTNYRYSEPEQYYRLDADTTVGYDLKKHVTLPKGTIVLGSASLADQKWTISFDLSYLSYTFRQKLGVADKVIRRTDGIDLRTSQLTPITPPATALPQVTGQGQSFWPTGLYPERKKGYLNKQLIKFTTDGYLDFYNNGEPQYYGSPNGQPTSRKILDIRDNGNVRTVTYDKAIPGLSGQPTTYRGKPATQLTVTLQPKINQDKYYQSGNARYQLNGQPYLQELPYEFFTDRLPYPVTNLTEQQFNNNHQHYNRDKFYRTKRPVKIKVAYSAYYGVDNFSQTVTIPKGTVVAGNQYSKKTLTIYSNRLNSRLLKPIYDRGFYPQEGWRSIKANATDFQRVKRPNYLPTWSDGALYLGANQAISNQDVKRSTLSLQITPNGYVEVRQNTSTAPLTTYYARPTPSVKIQRTMVKHHTRYLYLAKPLKGLKTTKVTTKGKPQYRLALTNQHKYRYARLEESVNYCALYTAGGKTFYTKIGSESTD